MTIEFIFYQTEQTDGYRFKEKRREQKNVNGLTTIFPFLTAATEWPVILPLLIIIYGEKLLY